MYRGRQEAADPTIESKTVWQVFEEERPFLMAYRGPFDGFHATEVAVSKTCLVRFCYSAQKFDPPESKNLKGLARRSASNLRAE